MLSAAKSSSVVSPSRNHTGIGSSPSRSGPVQQQQQQQQKHQNQHRHHGESSVEKRAASTADVHHKIHPGKVNPNPNQSPTNKNTNKKAAKQVVDRSKYKRVRESVIQHKKVKVFDDEHLGDDFMSYRWEPPSIARARNYAQQHMLRGGEADLIDTDVTRAPDLSIGANLYFLFLKDMSKFFFIASLLSIPSMIFCYYGRGIKVQDQDAMGLYRFSIGNIGYDPESPTYFEDSRCLKDASYTGTCLHIGASGEIKTSQAALLMSLSEIIIALVLYYFLSKLHSKCHSLEEETSGLICKVSSYSIQVKGLPKDATVEEVTDFYSKLYQLDTRDFLGRAPVENCRKVHSADFQLGEKLYVDTWVAECYIHKKIGKYITAFKDQQYILDKLYHYRAKMKMYTNGTAFAKGKNPDEYQKAEEEMKKWQKKFDDLTRSVKITAVATPVAVKTNQVAPAPPSGGINKGGNVTEAWTNSSTPKRRLSMKTTTTDIDADVISAFVVFQYTESSARAIEDCNKYSSFPFNLCYPEQMKFRGVHKLVVTKAAEPDELIWENLEVASWKKYFLRSFTTVATIAILLACFMIILQSTIYKEKFNSKIPDTSICKSVIPELFSDTFDFGSTYSWEDLELARPSNNSALLKSYDERCNQIEKNSFFGVYTYNPSDFYGYVSKPTVDRSGVYDFNACTANGYCPKLNSSTQCPCISTNSKEVCKSETCYSDPTNPECRSFKAGAIGGCYCVDLLQSLLTSSSIISVVNKLRTGDGIDPHCDEFFKQYAIASSIKYLAIGVTIVVNLYLPYLLQHLTEIEAHSSFDREKGSLMYKVFIPTFFNMAILVLVASGKISGQSDDMKALHLFQGIYTDFDPSWYGNIGTYFITTFMIQAVGPMILKLYDYFVFYPIIKWWHYKKIQTKTDTAIVRQSELNQIFVGEPFTFHGIQALLLSLFCFAMVYSPGIPMIAVTALIAFVIFFWVDKILLLRYHVRPRKSGNEIMLKVVNICKLAIFVRLAIACWMYGNPYILSPNYVKTAMHPDAAQYVPTSSYERYLYQAIELSKATTSGYTKIFGGRLLRPNVFFLLLFLISFIAFIVTKFIFRNFPIVIMFQKLYKCLCKGNEVAVENEGGKISQCDIQKSNHRYRLEVAPYTGIYYKYLLDPPKRTLSCCTSEQDERLELSADDVSDGWRIEYKTPYKFKMKLHNPEAGGGGGRLDYKHTYEVTADDGCNSYVIERVPEYQTALKGINEALEAYKNTKSLTGEVAFVDV